MNPKKIRTKDELISYLLYSEHHSGIFIAIRGDEDIQDAIDPEFADKIRKLLDKV